MMRCPFIVSRVRSSLRALLGKRRLSQAKDLVREHPRSAAAHAALGRAYAAAGQIIPSIAQFRTSLCLDETFTEVRLALAASYERKGLWDLAFQELRHLTTAEDTSASGKKVAAGQLAWSLDHARNPLSADAVANRGSNRKSFRLQQISPDRYMRLNTVSQEIERIAQGTRIQVLDVGGGDGLLSLFIPGHRYSLADPLTNGLTGVSLPFDGDDYDVVVACHALEHVDPNYRSAVVSEMARVARRRILILGPFRDSANDEKLDRLFWEIMRVDWAKEHLQFGLPTLKEMAGIIHDQGLSFRIRPSGSRGAVYWSVFAGYLASHSGRCLEYERMTEFFNHNYAEVTDVRFPNEYLVEITCGEP